MNKGYGLLTVASEVEEGVRATGVTVTRGVTRTTRGPRARGMARATNFTRSTMITIIALGLSAVSFNSMADQGEQLEKSAKNKTSLTIYSTANAGSITPELYRPVPGNENYNYPIPGYAIVQDQRDIELKQGKNSIDISNIPSLIDPTTVTFRSLTDPTGSRIIEQNYNFDLVNKKQLLEKYLGKEIIVEQNHGDQIATFNGKLLSAENAIVLQVKGGQYITISDYSNVRFPDLPGGLTVKPTLAWDISSNKTGNQKIETSYQTSGITWWADYNATYEEGSDANNGFLNLNAWISIINKSGASYENAKLKLIAGNVNRAQNSLRAMPVAFMASKASGAAEDAGFSEQAFFEYYLYSLGRETTILDNSTKQIELFSNTPKVAVAKEYLYKGFNESAYATNSSNANANATINTNREFPGQKNNKIDIYLKFKNDKAQGLGIPLPAGRIRVSKLDNQAANQSGVQSGSLEFIGEDVIHHSPKDEKISVKIGSAFDLVGERKQIDFSLDNNRHILKETFEISIRNHKDQAVNVVVTERLYRGDSWKILDNSSEYKKTDAHTIDFPITVNKDVEAKVKYTVEYTW